MHPFYSFCSYTIGIFIFFQPIRDFYIILQILQCCVRILPLTDVATFPPLA